MLATRGLEVRFGEVPAVRGIDLDVAAGAVVAVLGRNGAGKTTMLRALAGSLPVDAGTVVFDGADVTRLPAEHRVRAGIVLVPEGRRLFPGLSVRDNLAVGAYHRRLRPAVLGEEIERVTEHLPIVRQRLDQRAGSLSGGEQQQAAIARALMAAPRLLMADEPSLGLAPIVIEQVYDLFARLRADGLTLLVVEQYAGVALALADRAVVIDKGRIVLDGAAGDLAGSPELLDAYLSRSQEVPA